jgi:phosphatidate cytidylyltransferase
MAFHLQTFKTRTLTAIVFAVIMLAGLLINKWTFFALFSIIHFGCWTEYHKLIGLIDTSYQQIKSSLKYGIILLGWCFMMYMTSNYFKIGNMQLQGIGWLFMLLISIVLLATEIVFNKNLQIKNVGYAILGLLYISLSWGLMIDLRLINADTFFGDFGWMIPIVLIASIWINDTMAYIVGSFIGKTPFSAISPKKTWEGTIGGAVLAVAAVTTLCHFYMPLGDKIVIGISSIAAMAGTGGDLLESKLKRMAGVKDSGSIMPGHGGFLDRFDSLLLATPFVWLFLKFMAK